MRNTSVIAAATPAPTMIHGLTEYCLYLPRFSFLSLPPLLFLPLFFFFSKISSPSVRDERVSSRSRLVSRKKKMGSAFEFFEAITHSLPRSSFNEHSMRIHGCFFHEKVFSNEISTVFFHSKSFGQSYSRGEEERSRSSPKLNWSSQFLS